MVVLSKALLSWCEENIKISKFENYAKYAQFQKSEVTMKKCNYPQKKTKSYVVSTQTSLIYMYENKVAVNVSGTTKVAIWNRTHDIVLWKIGVFRKYSRDLNVCTIRTISIEAGTATVYRKLVHVKNKLVQIFLCYTISDFQT